MTDSKIPVGVSSCVLGNPVRYDGGNKHDKLVSQILNNYFTYQPICPEMAIVWARRALSCAIRTRASMHCFYFALQKIHLTISWKRKRFDERLML